MTSHNKPESETDSTAPPTRYDCLCCPADYLTDAELRSHVGDKHDPSDIVSALTPINIPPVTRFVDDPDITTDRDAKLAINRDDRDGAVPDPARQVVDGICPVCGADAATDAELPERILPQVHGNAHDTWEWYTVLRGLVPDEYDVSPTYDTAGRDDPAGTVMELVPDDIVELHVDGWEQSVSSGRFQRDTISDDAEWTATGVVLDVDDPRSDPYAHEFDQREVILRANTSVADDPMNITLSPSDDETVRLTMEPLVKQAETAQRWGRSGGGNVTATVIEAERTPWYERESDSSHN